MAAIQPPDHRVIGEGEGNEACGLDLVESGEETVAEVARRLQARFAQHVGAIPDPVRHVHADRSQKDLAVARDGVDHRLGQHIALMVGDVDVVDAGEQTLVEEVGVVARRGELRRARRVAGRSPGLDIIASDDFRGAQRATDYLLGRGLAPVGLIDTVGGTHNPEKFAGYQAALTAANLPADAGLIVNAACLRPHDAARHPRLGRSARGRRAGMVSRERSARAAGHPVMGFDDIEWAPFAEAPLSTVHYAAEDVAAKAVERMMALLEFRARLPRSISFMLEPELILRISA